MAKAGNIRRWLAIWIAVVIAVPVVWILATRLEGEKPAAKIDLTPDAAVGMREVAVSVADGKSGLRHLQVSLVKDGKESVLYSEDFPSSGFPGGGLQFEKEVALKLIPPGDKGADGKALVRLLVSDYSWRGWFNGNRTLVEFPVTIDTVRPRIDVVSQAHNVNQGGAGLVIYRLSEECPSSGVRVGDEYFPGYSGHFQDPALHLAFFALGHTQGRNTKLAVTASDRAGNTGTSGFYHHIRKKTFKKDNIRISDGFLDSKMPEFDKDVQETPAPIERFLKVNRDLRKANYETIRKVVSQTSDKSLYWKGPFLRLPNSARRAGFADQRDYLYNGKRIDHQVHLGIDLASLARSPVYAANAGRVVFSEDLGIYGLTVIIDHGFGLFSLYAHLSAIDVGLDQRVAKGDVIGRTGSTGLAGGDHLHFSMMVHHVFVNPVEWWDGAWIKNNITDKIASAGREASADKATGAAAGG
jgi:murein DD-endopeptidase MepM/ murein hydrolase activator NlpD